MRVVRKMYFDDFSTSFCEEWGFEFDDKVSMLDINPFSF